MKMKKQNRSQKNRLLLVLSAVVVLAAALTFLIPRLLQHETAVPTALSGDGSTLTVGLSGLGEQAVFYDFDADGVTVELFAVKASDGSIRMALNTCQVCNGSPYAYFVQDGDSFVCQNCMNRFSSTQVGIVSGGCNPVPITEENYSLEDGSILISTEFLAENAYRFKNWKNF